MVEQQERLWDFNAVIPGHAGPATVVEITGQNIAEYARLSQNSSRKYQESSPGAMAMPSMLLSYAPLLRDEIAEANSFVALEQSNTNRRQTPFAKCEIRWRKPVGAGDTITAERRVLEKYERRGSKFVTFRVEASNQVEEPVAEYDYTCIFEYAKGQQQLPVAPSNPQTGVNTAPEIQLLDLDDIYEGLVLPSLSVTETQDIINRKNDFRLGGRVSSSNIHTDEEFAQQNIFGGTVNSGPATLSYIDQALQLSFPASALYNGGKLLMRAITPFRSGDTVTFQGEITGKNPGSAVDCRVKGTNQRGELVCLADATLILV